MYKEGWVGFFWLSWHINMCRLFNAKFIFIWIIKQFSLAWVHSLIAKNILFQAIQFNQTVLVEIIHISLNMQIISI